MAGRHTSQGGLIGAVVAVALHAAFGVVLLSVDASRLMARTATVVEMDVREPPPPPLKIEPEPPKPPEPEPPKPRVVRRLVAAAPQPRQPPTPPMPPPPNAEPPKEAPKTPPVFGVTLSSTVAGEAAMAVPVGNTLMTGSRARAKPGETPQAYGKEGTGAFVPVPEVSIAEMPRAIHEENGVDYYPREALQMRLEGKVKLRLGIDDKGNVATVRVTEKAGYGFDEAATRALRKFKFSPARTQDGRAVPTTINYLFSFTIPP